MNEPRINYCIKRLKNCKKETLRVWMCVDGCVDVCVCGCVCLDVCVCGCVCMC